MSCLVLQDQYIYIHDCLSNAIERGLHLGPEQNIYVNTGMIGDEEEEEENEGPLYENWENGPGRNVLVAHEAALLPYRKDSDA